MANNVLNDSPCNVKKILKYREYMYIYIYQSLPRDIYTSSTEGLANQKYESHDIFRQCLINVSHYQAQYVNLIMKVADRGILISYKKDLQWLDFMAIMSKHSKEILLYLNSTLLLFSEITQIF